MITPLYRCKEGTSSCQELEWSTEGRNRPVRPKSALWALPLLGDSRWLCGLREVSAFRWEKIEASPQQRWTRRWGGARGLGLRGPRGLGAAPLPSSHLSLPCRSRHQRRPGALQHRHQHPGGVHQQGGCLGTVSGPRTASAPPPARGPQPPFTWEVWQGPASDSCRPAADPSAVFGWPAGGGPRDGLGSWLVLSFLPSPQLLP